MSKSITVSAVVNKDIKTVWDCWNNPEHIVNWMHASDDWECTKSVNDLRGGGRFSNTLGAKDKSSSFDFGGEYTAVEENKHIASTIDDGRKIEVTFTDNGDNVKIDQTFEMENENTEELQRSGWQATLDNFKSYAESQS